LPHNIVNVSMDLYLQSQSDEEQWFMCAPHSVWYQSKHELGFCGHTAFREGVVTVDGRPAGIAPIYPWIYTGGMDPYLWAPIPGVQTLNFTPYRVDLTPFAGYLSTTATPTIAVTVQGAFHYFSGAGDLLLYLDPKRSQVTGSVTSDSLTIPSPPGTSGITYAAGSGLFGGKPAAGPAHVRAHQAFLIDGYVNTSSGKVETSVYQEMRFANDEAFVYTPTSYVQDVTQSMTLHSQVKTIAGKTSAVEDSEYEYPIDVAYPITQTTTGYQLPITVYQGDYVRHAYCCAGPLRGNAAARRFASNSVLNDTVESADTMIFDSAFNWTGVANGSSSQLYTYRDSSGTCYGREITSKNNVVASDHPTACTKPSPTPPPTPAPSRRR
ncbi:MAG TPA: peptide-N4-asparagine amidase, partial [Candidatus Acidoferrales bacterium]|nr:peptide-N4-asparagine amidase [Candidatus Acidoferrales bacterium]